MAGTMVISIRFHEENHRDMELYDRLKQDAGEVMSLAAVAKERIRVSYQSEEKKEEKAELLEQVTKAVREEMKDSGMKIAGAILSGMQGTQRTFQRVPEKKESVLPEEGGQLPEGTWDFLDSD